MPRLIWVFAGHTVILLVLSWGGSFAFTDGSCLINPGPCGAGAVVYLPNQEPAHVQLKILASLQKRVSPTGNVGCGPDRCGVFPTMLQYNDKQSPQGILWQSVHSRNSLLTRMLPGKYNRIAQPYKKRELLLKSAGPQNMQALSEMT